MKKFGVLFFVLFLVGSVSAVDYYVSVNGDDSNDGLSYNTPIKNISKAVTSAMPGDTIYFLAGTYGYNERMHDSGLIYLYPSVGVRSGNVTHPITIRSYPGEHVILNGTGVSDSIGVRRVSYWTIQGFEIIRGVIHLYDGLSTSKVHDIVIKENYIHDKEIYTTGNNVGLIVVDVAGNQGATYNVFIWNNTISEVYYTGEYGDWQSMTDEQHMAGITTLSACAYYTYSYGCTGYIEIINNSIYNVPQIFFFKNAMDGPIKIENNLLYTAGALGINVASNVLFRKNIVYNVDGGFSRLGTEDECVIDDLCKVSGNNCTIIQNTFVGINSMLDMRSGVNHTVKNNILFGLSGRRTGADYDTLSYVTRSSASYVLDPNDPALSSVQTVDSDYNCFITPYADFLSVKRYLASSQDYYNLSEATQTFDFDANSISIVESNSANIFVDPSAHNYNLINPDLCPNMGYYSSEYVPPSEEEDCSLTYDTSPCNCLTNIELGNGVNAWFRGELGIGDLMQHLNLWRTNSSC